MPKEKVFVKYHWRHIPTGITNEATLVLDYSPTYMGRALEQIAKWNAQMPGIWQYWL